MPNVPLIHRDLSWIQFNERVLAESRHSSGNPLLERLKFLAISASNLDEFFLVRFPSVNKKATVPTTRSKEICSTILEAIAKFTARQTESLEALSAELEAIQIRIVLRVRNDRALLDASRALFVREILPKIKTAPQIQDLKGIENLQMVAVLGEGKLIAIPKHLPLMYALPLESGSLAFFFLDDLLQTFVSEDFGTKHFAGVVRLSRDSDMSVALDDLDSASIPDYILKKFEKRDQGTPVRLQYRGDLPEEFLDHAAETLKLGPEQLFPAPTSLCLHGLWTVLSEASQTLNLPQTASYPPSPATPPKAFQSAEVIFNRIKKRDFLLHHPYDTFTAFERWLQLSADDKDVESIELAIYRTGIHSPLVDALKKSAKKKLIRVFIEPRARFDELNNVDLAKQLSQAGAEVKLGFGALKLHAKIALVTRNENGVIRRYTHLSTGNYNSATARVYTDLAILTAHPEIGADARTFFDSCLKGVAPSGLKQLVPAPTQMHRKLLSLIRNEIQSAEEGKKTRIVAKVNALVDESIIEALYEASQKGVSVDLIVRGACSLVPGVAKLSRNIRVVSIVDRYLEHSRIYYFESQKAMYLSSADWMPRNFYSRLELAFPVLEPRIFEFIRDVLVPTYLKDNVKAKELTQQGTWIRKPRPANSTPCQAQRRFQELAEKNYEGTSLFDGS
jgi:polyphosphate kinase